LARKKGVVMVAEHKVRQMVFSTGAIKSQRDVAAEEGGGEAGLMGGSTK